MPTHNLMNDYIYLTFCPMLDMFILIFLIFIILSWCFIGDPAADGELCVRMQFSDREVVIRAIKIYNIPKGEDYKVYESEATRFYCKCVRYGIDCGWLVKASFRKNKYYWEIMKYNGPHTCT